jgi:hypothetical protein
MKTSYEYDGLSAKILEALALLDQKGTNETVTQTMSIVYEAFRCYAANLQFSAKDLLSIASD